MQSTIYKFFTLIEIIAFVALILYLFINRHNVPIFDEWAMASLVESYHNGNLDISQLNSPHNECRMLYPHLINIFIIVTTKWQSFYLVAFNMVLLFVFYLIFKREVKQMVESKSTVITVTVSMLFLGCFMMIFSFKNYESIIMGFALNYYLSIVATFGALIILKKITWKNVIISCLLVHIATFSYVTGFLSWGCVLIVIFFSNITKPMKIRYILFVLSCFLGQLYFYFTGYNPNVSITERTMDFMKIIPYSLVFLSNNFSTTVWITISFSIVQLLSIMTASYLLFKFDKGKLNKLMPLITFGLFGVLTSLMTAYGRAFGGVEQSLSRRYCALSLPFTLFFLVSAIILVTYLEKFEKPKYIQNMVAGVIVLFLGYITFSQVRYIKFAEERNKEILVAKKHILQGDYLHATVRNAVCPSPEIIESGTAILKKRQLSLYNR